MLTSHPYIYFCEVFIVLLKLLYKFQTEVLSDICIVILSSYNLFSFNLKFLVYLMVSRFSPTRPQISSVKKCAFLLLSKEFSILPTNDNHVKISYDYLFKHGRNISKSYWAATLCHSYFVICKFCLIFTSTHRGIFNLQRWKLSHRKVKLRCLWRAS